MRVNGCSGDQPGPGAIEQMARDTVGLMEALESRAHKYTRLRELGISSGSAIQIRPTDNSRISGIKPSPGMIR